MSKKFFQFKSVSNYLFLSAILSFLMIGGCAVQAAKTDAAEQPAAKSTDPAMKIAAPNAAKTTRGATIEIEQNSPADTVRVFYKDLRENRFRDAMFLTNLRPAIEGLTDTELQDLQLDLAPIAQQIPAEIEINGEIISGSYATVTAKLPDNETKQLELQEIRLRKEGNFWVILTVDEQAEATIKKEGNQYFFNLRLQTHESEAKAMLERVAKAEMVFALQSGGTYGEIAELVQAGLLPDDALTADSTGYNYRVNLTDGRKKYFATADPAVYGKTGKLSFLLELDAKNGTRLSTKDNGGQPLKK
ncbi:MAG: hypothetical protein JSS81_14955 [Acidobacteria bacterium]|nr:hypothetical protein [Acidobacteriota bacterium]